jgi:hypothetical protein
LKPQTFLVLAVLGCCTLWFCIRVGPVIVPFLAPITFYGRVIDQFGAPVQDAQVEFLANDKPLQSSSKYTTRTDKDGLFSIKWIHGLTLAVALAKPGYRRIPADDNKVTSSGMFEYGIGTPHKPSKNSPTLFRLHKVGNLEPLLAIPERNYRLARKGLPCSISLDQQGGHNVVLRCWNQELQRPAGQRQYDWRLEVSVANGGLVPRNDPFGFEAPEAGYLPRDSVEMPSSLEKQWRSFAERSYFIRFDDGTFGRADLRMHAHGDHFVVWESFFNSNPGSRNLENDPDTK